ncbi:uncharacterized protein N7529_003554 [Penicillium soppii]|uniref:uncharacterized protein n=1 Tax=Penicillium soppii TaxID=69789 RepID=UPI002546925E|nr:uncharacterized protein N7529_003554 [Penicillium soppii]KAJ5871201.1 hypothetical protein N7529_003554 [Penicillium soppii]
MAPKQETSKKVVKRAPANSPAKLKDPELKKQLLFLWSCFKSADANVNFATVAHQYGIKNSAAQKRFSRLKRKIEEMEAAEKANSSNDEAGADTELEEKDDA